MVNKVILVGNLCADPELRALPDGRHVANLRVATNTYLGRDEDGNRREAAEFHTLVVFGRPAEVAGTYLRKGSLLYAEGRLQHRSWEGADGQKRHASEVVADRFHMLGGKPEDAIPVTSATAV
ncbi:MAG TPA: single-stranded DNA-binding protein [Candidatus Binatia bacterium]|jgi:single-strand DNA-binding protein|nr:single-stranded DNA-binding protein [Candidatus Binatia bacterium]